MSSHVRIDRNLARREAALRFLLSRIDYERARNVPYRPREFKLQRMRELLERLDNPQLGLPIVHVAGTKGKGSTAAMIGAALTAAGCRTGVFTSPHLERIDRRIAVDGRPCSGEELVAMVERVRPATETMDRAASETGADEIGPTYFELTTAMALLHFARGKVDAAVLEVGLGGRLDSTNVCTPRLSIITSISFDHTRQLGNTLRSIAREKAGIIKPGVPVVSGVIEEEPREVIREVCRRRGCRLVELGVDFDFTYHPPRHLERAPAAGRLDFHYPLSTIHYPLSAVHYPLSTIHYPLSTIHYPLALLGRHQAANAAVAVAALAELRRAGWQIPEVAVRAGLAKAACPARVELVARRPAIVLDAAHNPASIDALLRVLEESFSPGRRLLVFAATEGKDVRGMLDRLLGRFDEVILTRYLTNPRAVPPEELAGLAAELTGRRYAVCSEPADAFDAIRESAGPDDLICITGSFFIAAEIRHLLATRPVPADHQPLSTIH